MNLWNQTYKCDYLHGAGSLAGIDVCTAIAGDATHRLVARIEINGDANGVSVAARCELSADQMRALADILLSHAERIEHTLIPAIHSSNRAPVALYAEPEAA